MGDEGVGRGAVDESVGPVWTGGPDEGQPMAFYECPDCGSTRVDLRPVGGECLRCGLSWTFSHEPRRGIGLDVIRAMNRKEQKTWSRARG
jgi:hypothetical protein